VTDRPILFSAPMILALIAGRKTQTRRVLRAKPGMTIADAIGWVRGIGRRLELPVDKLKVPFVVGDRLYVREAWKTHAAYDDISPAAMGGEEAILYDADGAHQTWGYPAISKIGRFRQGMHMPRWASRMTLSVTEVRVQRLHDITDADALSEGVSPLPSGRFHCGQDDGGEITAKSPVTAYAWLWNHLNEARGFGWDADPWVVAVSFSVEHRNIDEASP